MHRDQDVAKAEAMHAQDSTPIILTTLGRAAR